jgi:hypothetical protein
VIAGMLAEYHRTQPRDGKGKHRHLPEEFGINPAELRERMHFYTQSLDPPIPARQRPDTRPRTLATGAYRDAPLLSLR